MTTSSASTITARDFSARVTDPQRDLWTLGKMRHVVADLNGGEVTAIVLDKMTGWTLTGVRLVGVRPTSGHECGQGRLIVESAYDDGETQRTAYRLEDVGAIVAPITSRPSVKHNAVNTYHDEVSAAIRVARELHGEVEGRAWGRWTGECHMLDEVYVHYEPSTGNPFYAEQWGTPWHGVIHRDQYAALVRS